MSVDRNLTMLATNFCMYLGRESRVLLRDFGHEFSGGKCLKRTPFCPWMFVHRSGTCERLWLLFHWFCSLCVRCVCAWFDLNVWDTLDVSSWHIYFLDSMWVSLQNPLICFNEVTSRRTCTVLLSSAMSSSSSGVNCRHSNSVSFSRGFDDFPLMLFEFTEILLCVTVYIQGFRRGWKQMRQLW